MTDLTHVESELISLTAIATLLIGRLLDRGALDRDIFRDQLEDLAATTFRESPAIRDALHRFAGNLRPAPPTEAAPPLRIIQGGKAPE